MKLDIDIKCNNGLQLAEPTKYKSLDGATKAYKCHKDSIYKYDIMTLPTWLYKIIINSSSVIAPPKTKAIKPKQEKNKPTQETLNSPIITETQIETPSIQSHSLNLKMFEDFELIPSQEHLD